VPRVPLRLVGLDRDPRRRVLVGLHPREPCSRGQGGRGQGDGGRGGRGRAGRGEGQLRGRGPRGGAGGRRGRRGRRGGGGRGRRRLGGPLGCGLLRLALLLRVGVGVRGTSLGHGGRRGTRGRGAPEGGAEGARAGTRRRRRAAVGGGGREKRVSVWRADASPV